MRRFGEIVVDEGFATEEQIEAALAYQKTSEILVGKILIDMRVLTHGDVERVSAFLKAPECRSKGFGEAAVFMGVCSQADVDRAMEVQRTSKGMLGDLLVALGYITDRQREEILRLQLGGG
jgi:hypothetical protein